MSAEPNVIQIHNPTEVTSDRMGAELLKALVDEVRMAPAQWSKLNETQQEMLIARLRSTVQSETRKAVQLIVKSSHEAASVKIESLTVKDGVKIVLQTDLKAARDVLSYVSQSAVLVMCRPEQYFGAMNEVTADKDQPELPLGDGAQVPQAAAATPLTADVQVGDKVRFLNASPDGLVRDVRGVNRNVDPPRIEVTGMPDEFAIALFELVESDPIAEVEAEEAAEAAADDDDDTDGDEGGEDAAALSADAAADEASRASAGKRRPRAAKSRRQNGADATEAT